MEQPTRFVGMDVHKDTIVVAVTATGEVGKATAYGTFPNTAAALETLVKRLRQAGDGPIKFCYEAGPCGYGIHRALTKMGEDCMVVAPSLIPRKSGERQKNDKRDAASLAVLHRGGLLTAVWVPDAAHEAMRDLIRARLAAVRAVRAARQQLSAFLLRHERIYPAGRTAWTKAHRGWLANQSFAQPAQQIVLEESIEAVRLGEQRRDRVDGYLRAQIPSWSLFPLVQNLGALRGLDTVASAGLAAAIGDPSRFASAPDFMAYLGLVPSEHSTGRKRHMGAITKAGDIHARTLLQPRRCRPARAAGGGSNGQGIRPPAFQRRHADPDFTRHQVDRRTFRRQQPRHYPIFVRLSVSSHFLLSTPPRFRSYLGGNWSDTEGETTSQQGSLI